MGRVVHNDPECRVCRTTGPGMFRTAAPIPPPFPNPEYRPGQKGLPKRHDGRGYSEGGPHGLHWYHGTTFSPQEEDEGDHPDSRESGGRLLPPQTDNSENSRTMHHWNTDLGVHFTSLHHVAKEKFAGSGRDDIDSRVAHATLHMANPKRFDDETDLGRDAIHWAHSQGHHYLPEHDEAHEQFAYGNTDVVEKHDPHGRSYLYHQELPLGRDERRAISHIDRNGVRNGTSLKHIDNYLASHPDREALIDGYRKHLRSEGHDGIVYGNDYEGPTGHTSAIAFPDTPIGIHKWEWLHKDSQNMPATPQEAHERRQRGELPDEDQMKLFGRRATAADDWSFEHRQMSPTSWRTFGGPGEDRRHMLDYTVPEPGRVVFPHDGFETKLDSIRRRKGDEVADHLQRGILEHHQATGTDSKSWEDARPKKTERRVYYHGTTVPNVTHILPATAHGGGLVFPQETSPEHAYATTDLGTAWTYAQKASDVRGGMRPRVYQVRPIGGHQHVEDDPHFDAAGTNRGNYAGDKRSKRGFEVVRELQMPRDVGHPDNWDDDNNPKEPW